MPFAAPLLAAIGGGGAAAGAAGAAGAGAGAAGAAGAGAAAAGAGAAGAGAGLAGAGAAGAGAAGAGLLAKASQATGFGAQTGAGGGTKNAQPTIRDRILQGFNDNGDFSAARAALGGDFNKKLAKDDNEAQLVGDMDPQAAVRAVIVNRIIEGLSSLGGRRGD